MLNVVLDVLIMEYLCNSRRLLFRAILSPARDIIIFLGMLSGFMKQPTFRMSMAESPYFSPLILSSVTFHVESTVAPSLSTSIPRVDTASLFFSNSSMYSEVQRTTWNAYLLEVDSAYMNSRDIFAFCAGLTSNFFSYSRLKTLQNTTFNWHSTLADVCRCLAQGKWKVL